MYVNCILICCLLELKSRKIYIKYFNHIYTSFFHHLPESETTIQTAGNVQGQPWQLGTISTPLRVVVRSLCDGSFEGGNLENGSFNVTERQTKKGKNSIKMTGEVSRQEDVHRLGQRYLKVCS